jgi:hypothetical protein
MSLSLHHGNADVEKRLSVNNSIITKERSQLSKAAINGLRDTDAVKLYDLELMRPEKFLMTIQVLLFLSNFFKFLLYFPILVVYNQLSSWTLLPSSLSTADFIFSFP